MTDTISIPTLPSLAPVIEEHRKRSNPASHMLGRIQAHLSKFERIMGPDKELGFAVGTSTGTYHLRQIHASDPDLLIFTALDADGNDVQVIQHHSQLSITLLSLPKLHEQAHRIGFGLPHSDE